MNARKLWMKARRVALAKKSKKKKQEEEIPEAWLLPYSDLLTLLLALFIVLFAMSSIDAQKMAKMSAVFNEVFEGGQGVMDSPSATDPEDPKSQKLDSSAAQAVKAYTQDQAELSGLQDDVENYIAVNELEKQFSAKMTDDGLLITIRDSVLFKSGEAEIEKKNRKIAKDLSKMLVFDEPRPVMVTGYTDNIPASGKYTSNWELSVMRAVHFLSVLIDTNDKLDPAYFSAKGYGENNPLASNDTEKGRAKNRRVEVLIQPLVEKDGTRKDINVEASTKEAKTERPAEKETTEADNQ